MTTTDARPEDTLTMQAMVITRNGGPEVLMPARIPVPIRHGSDVLVRVVAAGVNPFDVEAREGRGGDCGGFFRPVVLGSDFSGVVVESPYEAHPLKPGQEVFGIASTPGSPGSYAEYVSVPALSVARKPTSLSHLEAAAVPLAALTAWGLIVDVAKVHEGQRILVQAGAGGVGHFAVQFAAYFGAQVTTTASARNASWLRQLGAVEIIDHTTEDFAATVSGVDVALNLVDDDAVAIRTVGAVRPGGLFVQVPVGDSSGVEAAASAAGVRFTDYAVSPDAAALAIIARLVDSGDVGVYVDDVYDLAEVADAHRLLARGHTRGKLVLRVADE